MLPVRTQEINFCEGYDLDSSITRYTTTGASVSHNVGTPAFDNTDTLITLSCPTGCEKLRQFSHSELYLHALLQDVITQPDGTITYSTAYEINNSPASKEWLNLGPTAEVLASTTSVIVTNLHKKSAVLVPKNVATNDKYLVIYLAIAASLVK